MPAIRRSAMMRRLQLFEFEDFPWFPNTIRNLMTDYLRHVTIRLRLYEPIARKLRDAMQHVGSRKIVDLCSGGGGLLPQIHNDLVEHQGFPVSVVFTDKYPNLESLHRLCEKHPRLLSLERESVDATRVPSTLKGFRTLFSAFHHFPPHVAREILRDAVRQRTGIAIFELSQRSLIGLVPMFLTPFGALLFTPMIRPFTFPRVLWTYLIPIVPAFLFWDGVVSSLRTYSTQELESLVGSLGDNDYEWDVGQCPAPNGFKVTYLVGTPPSAPEESTQWTTC
jgi:hypothetical protein